MASVMAACATRTEYVKPATHIPATWQHGEVSLSQAAQLGDHWWRNFNDPQLNQLIEQALAQNNDLAAAALTVRRAQLQAGLAVTNPTINLSGGPSVSRTLSGNHATTKSVGLTGSVGYELDLWGKLASQRDAAQWELLATEEDRESAALTLIGTTATLYWKIAYTNQRIAYAEQSMAYVTKLLNLVKVQHDAGAVSGLEVLQAEQALAAQEAAYTQLLQQRVEARNALAILFDGPPTAMTYVEHQALPIGALPVVGAGIPMQLVGRRPDLKASELRLRASLANTDVARLNYYPGLSLTGTLGTSSSDLLKILQNPVASLGAGLTFPFLQWSQMQRNIKVSELDYQKAVIAFRQKLYTALSDVENALSARTQFQAQAEKLTTSLATAKAAESLYAERYRNGAVALRLWLDAQETRRSAEAALIDNHYSRLVNQVTLYQALGGDAVAGE